MKSLQVMKCFLVGAAALLFSATARADPIVLDQWYTFGFQGVGAPLQSGTGFVLGQRSVAIGDAPWEFECPTYKCHLTVTDGFLAVDQFELFDFGVSLGQTSAPSGDDSHSCSNDELACLADPQMSHGVFVLAQGAHSITGVHLAGIPGAAFLIVQVPEPASLLLVALGLLGLGWVRRRT